MYITKWLYSIIVLFTVNMASIITGSQTAIEETFVPTEPVKTAALMEVELNDNFFHPKNITVPIGETTTLKLKNKGSLKHTFTVEELNIDVELDPGQEKSITIAPKNTGTYELICRFHFQRGMVGNLIVK